MEKFIPYEKLSKKEKRKMDLAKRQTWGELNPVTRKPENSKAYNRKRTQDWKKELPDLRPFLFIILINPHQNHLGFACELLLRHHTLAKTLFLLDQFPAFFDNLHIYFPKARNIPRIYV